MKYMRGQTHTEAGKRPRRMLVVSNSVVESWNQIPDRKQNARTVSGFKCDRAAMAAST
jgi:hypothetical protein